MTAVMVVQEIAYEGSINDLAYRGPVLRTAEVIQAATLDRPLRSDRAWH